MNKKAIGFIVDNNACVKLTEKGNNFLKYSGIIKNFYNIN